MRGALGGLKGVSGGPEAATSAPGSKGKRIN